VTAFSVGHSNHSLDDFLELLRQHNVAEIADIRAFPGSRRWPHFARESLSSSLAQAGIEYRWMPELGGRRQKSKSESKHTAWTVEAFRTYADYADTKPFENGPR